ncbi:HpcH/HpaI aldolase family protein [Halostagnicola bangensis]
MDQINDFRRTIENNGSVLGARSSTFSPAVIEIYGELGLDFVWLDFEHMGPSPYDSTMFEELTRAADVGGIELFVRLPSADPSLVRKVLDTGVRNILIPRIDDAEEVHKAVKASRFVYENEPGERGMASGRARTWGLSEDYVSTEDDEVCVGVMIEKTTAVDNLDEILSVPELGFVFVGPSDLSVQMGHPTNKNHPDVTAQIAEIEDACKSADVPMGCIANSPDKIESVVEDGYQIVRMGGDLSAIQDTLAERLSEIGEL